VKEFACKTDIRRSRAIDYSENKVQLVPWSKRMYKTCCYIRTKCSDEQKSSADSSISYTI